MKKLALISSLLFLAAKADGSCGAGSGQNPVTAAAAENQIHPGYFFGAVFVLLVPIIILYFLRKRRGLWVLLAGAGSALLMVGVLAGAAVFLSFFGGSCAGNDGSLLLLIIKGECLIMLSLLIFQTVAWVRQFGSSDG